MIIMKMLCVLSIFLLIACEQLLISNDLVEVFGTENRFYGFDFNEGQAKDGGGTDSTIFTIDFEFRYTARINGGMTLPVADTSVIIGDDTLKAYRIIAPKGGVAKIEHSILCIALKQPPRQSFTFEWQSEISDFDGNPYIFKTGASYINSSEPLHVWVKIKLFKPGFEIPATRLFFTKIFIVDEATAPVEKSEGPNEVQLGTLQ